MKNRNNQRPKPPMRRARRRARKKKKKRERNLATDIKQNRMQREIIMIMSSM